MILSWQAFQGNDPYAFNGGNITIFGMHIAMQSYCIDYFITVINYIVLPATCCLTVKTTIIRYLVLQIKERQKNTGFSKTLYVRQF